MVRPALAQADPGERAPGKPKAVAWIGADREREGVVALRVVTAVFEEVDVVAQLRQAQGILEVVPGHPPEGIADDDAEHEYP